MKYPYVIIGGGLTAASAVEGIREHDKEGAILILSRDNHRPYHRPPLSKGLWFGKETLDTLPVHEPPFYREQNVELMLRREAVELDPAAKKVWDERDVEYEYGKLLLATGGHPRLLDAPGSTIAGVHYYRYLEDYLQLQNELPRFEHALVVGGGFIGVEMAAALKHAGKEVTLLYPEEYPLRRVLPRELGLHLADLYRERGIEVISGESIASFEERGTEILARTHSGNSATTQLVLVGAGLVPHTDLADAAGLEVSNGILVDEFTRTSDPDIHAAGDVAEFPYRALERSMRVEHWDHAIFHGRAAGANMAGANRPYDHLPMFFSDHFDIGWEAVGEVDSSAVVEAVWRERYKEGVIFYLRDEVIRGVLMWNSWGLVDWARDLIRAAKPMTVEERAKSIPAAG